MKLSRAHRRLAVVVIMMSVAAGFAVNVYRDLRLSDDNVFLYVTSHHVLDPGRSQAVQSPVLDAIRAMDDDETQYRAERFEARIEFGANYIVPSLVLRASGIVADRVIVDRDEDYERYIAAAVTGGLVGLSAFGLIVFVVWAARRDDELLLAIAMAVAVVIATSVLETRISTALGTGGLARQAVDPGYIHSPFGITPRNTLLVLFTAAVVSRWRGAIRWPYVGMAAAVVGLHTVSGMLLLGLLLVLDLVGRPEVLRDRVVLASIVVGAGWFAWRSTVLDAVNGTWFGVGLVVIGCAVAAVVWSVRNMEGLRRRAGALQRRIGRVVDRAGLVAVDALLMVVAVPAAQLVSTLSEGNGTASSDQHLWSQLAGRVLVGVRTPVLVAVAVILIPRLVRVSARIAPTIILAGTAAIALGATYLVLTEIDNDRPSLVAQAHELNAVLRGESPGMCRFPEDALYLGVARALDGDPEPLRAVTAMIRAGEWPLVCPT